MEVCDWFCGTKSKGETLKCIRFALRKLSMQCETSNGVIKIREWSTLIRENASLAGGNSIPE